MCAAHRTRILLGCLATLGIAVFAASALPADHADRNTAVPIKRVILFNTGVGYFEHQGTVDGDADLELSFAPDELKDVLKSLIAEDLRGGKIVGASYSTPASLDDQLAAFRVDLRSTPTLAELLQQLRGETVEVSGPGSIAGTILGVESRPESAGVDEPLMREYLNLSTEAGLRSLPLNTLTHIRLLDDSLQRQLAEALKALADNRGGNTRTLQLRCAGQGERPVRVGYLRASPVWKVSYRLILGRGDQPSTLQGWAIVENTSPSDWEDVQLTLVNGHPISFQMPLDEPLFVSRPEVKTPAAGAPKPRAHDRASQLFTDADQHAQAGNGGVGGGMAGGMMPGMPGGMMPGGMGGMAGGMMGGSGMGGYAGGMGPGGGTPRAGASAGGGGGGFPTHLSLVVSQTQEIQAQTWEIQAASSVAARASGARVGEFFQYRLIDTVRVPSRRTGLLPILSEPAKIERVSIFTPGINPRELLHAVRLTNSSTHHLAAGPMTLVDQGRYAGDANLAHLRPGESRLISFAADLELGANVRTRKKEPALSRVALTAGLLTLDYEHSKTIGYRFHSLADEPRQIVVEHPRPGDDWRVIQPAVPLEVTESVLRFQVAVAPRQLATLLVTEQQTTQQQERLANRSDESLRALLGEPKSSDAVKEQLRKVLALRGQLAELHGELQRLDARQRELDSDQQRIRANMKELDRASELYQRYVKSLADQENQLAEMREQGRRLRETWETARQQLEQIAPPGTAADDLFR